MELRARRGAMAVELRMQQRQAGMEPGVAHAAAQGAG